MRAYRFLTLMTLTLLAIGASAQTAGTPPSTTPTHSMIQPAEALPMNQGDGMKMRDGTQKKMAAMDAKLIMLEGITLLWFALTALSVLFVAVDIRTTPASPVLKWAFVLITFFIGPFGAFLYVLGCR
ncbi:MAG: hypothetical protein ABI718_17715, partial [Acidobacteriota bacterium]